MSRKRSQNFLNQIPLRCPANAFDARPNAAAGRGDLFIGSAFDALLKIHQPRADKNRMGVRIHEAGQHDFARTVDLGDLLRFFLSQGSRSASLVVPTETIFPPRHMHGTVFDDAEFLEVGTATRTGLAGRRSKGDKLADVGKK